jgi:iron(III) transport system substrate-binding protein
MKALLNLKGVAAEGEVVAIMKTKFFALLLVGLLSCSKSSEKKTIWIYTSLYKEVLSLFDPHLQKQFPQLEIKWYQAGSEDVSAKILAEKKGGKTQASLLMTSDIFFYLDLAEKGELLNLEEAALSKLDAHYANPDKNIAVVRLPVMVMAFNPKFVKADEAPVSVKEMLSKKFRSKTTMPSPLQSGTALTSLFFLEKQLGGNLLAQLKESDVLAAGGNGATLARILSGERPLGLVLMENVLQAHTKGQHDVVYQIPEEGAMPIPSPLSVLKDTEHPAEATAVASWFMGDQAQEIIRQAWLYAVSKKVAPPNGAPDYASLHKMEWTWPLLSQWKSQREDMKKRFQESVLR